MTTQELIALGAISIAVVLALSATRAFLPPSPRRRWLVGAVLVAGVCGLAAVVAAYHSDSVRNIWRHVSFQSPLALSLLLLIPLVVRLSYRSLAPLGEARRVVAVILRSTVLALLVLALARFSWVSWSHDLSVIVAVDVSDSVPVDQRAEARRWIEEKLLSKPPDDRAGLIYFAAEPWLEVPPVPYLELMDPETQLDRTATNIAAAIRLAQASFPDDTARRILLVTDGNETAGDAIQAAAAAAADGIPIDVYPILYRYDNDVAVERVIIPPNVPVGETVRIRVLLKTRRESTGTLRVYVRTRDSETLIAERRVRIQRQLPGQQEIIHAEDVLFRVEQPGFYRFTAEFSPDDPSLDRTAQNNALSSFTNVRAKARVLIAGAEENETAFLARVLSEEDFEVTTTSPGNLPSAVTELASYDLVVLNNVPATLLAGEDARADYIGTRQMEALERAVHDAGTGLVVIGGPDSYGAGGYDDTPLEEALPVDMDVPALKIVPKGALVCIFHASEMPRGNYWQKVVAKEAIRVLSPRDEVGVVAWRGMTAWIHPLQPAGDKRLVLQRIDRMTPGDMPDADPGLRLAHAALKKSTAMQKLIIMISDFDPTAPRNATVQQLIRDRIPVTCVAVATHGGTGANWAPQVAKQTGGRFYNVQDPRALPRIFFREARTVARSLIFERETPWKPLVAALTTPVADLDPDSLPPIYGYVTTTAKTSELVQVPIVSTLPLADQPTPILAHWRYGLGKSVAFTSDLAARWCRLWPGWTGYRQFWTRILRWAIRELENEALRIHTRLEDGKLIVAADALAPDGSPLNFADVVARVVTPRLESHELRLTQVGPGRYEGEIEGLTDMGSYLVSAAASHPRTGIIQSVTGVSVPYPEEYSFLESNELVLASIATITGGQLINPSQGDVDPFRRDFEPRHTYRSLWQSLLLAAAVVFFLDVLNRKIVLSLAPLREWHRRRREAQRELDERLQRLRRRKQAATERWKPVRTEVPPERPVQPVQPVTSSTRPSSTQTSTFAPPRERADEDLTRRLLEAKKRALRHRKHPTSPDESPRKEDD